MKDKVLFTKACSICTGKADDDVAWLTMSKFKPEPGLFISEQGKLIQQASKHFTADKLVGESDER